MEPEQMLGILGLVGSRLISDYRELPPPTPLAPYLECLWVQRISDGCGEYAQPVLPDACIDLVAIGDDVLLAGPATRSTTLHLQPGTLTVGARLRTGVAPALIDVSAAELRDADHRLADVWGHAGMTLESRLADEDTWDKRAAVLVDALLDRLARGRTVDPVGAGVAALLNSDPTRPLIDVAELVGLSERQFRRRVEDAVGYAPKTLARILRFRRFLRAARAAGPGRHLAALAAEAAYADQAHLTRESRELSGLPPAALLRWEDERLNLLASPPRQDAPELDQLAVVDSDGRARPCVRGE
jgi:AraC-like DNA-binding protein